MLSSFALAQLKGKDKKYSIKVLDKSVREN